MKVNNPISTLIVQSKPKFEETIKGFKEVGEFPHYMVKDGVSSSENKYSKYANTCSILAMSNGEETYIGHFAPEYFDSKFSKSLDYIVSKFKDKTGQLSAMITGGFSRFASGNPKEVEKSYEQLAKIGEVVDKHTPQITMIAGKLEPTFTDNLAVTSDKFILSHSPILGKKSPLPKIDPKSSEEECKAFFDKYYEISDLDATPTIIFDA